MLRFFLVLICVANCGWAAQFGYFTYIDTGTSITITGYAEDGLANVAIPSSISGKPVTVIGENAFQASYHVTNVTIPSTVTIIGSSAFQSCGNLTDVAIPASVTSIGDRSFAFCNLLTAFLVDPLNPVFSSSDGILFDKNQTTLILCPAGKNEAISIPASATGIAGYAFYYCRKLTTVTIPATITSIGESAFAGCSSLTGVSIPDGVASVNYGTFFSCTSLASVTIPGSVAIIGDLAFELCNGLTSLTIPSSVTTIGNAAFAGCIKLGNVTIPNSVTTIGSHAFQSCYGLVSVTLPGGITSIEDGTFDSCMGLTGIAIPAGVTSIGNAAFNYCESLVDIVIPASVTSIANDSFYRCSNMTSIAVDSLNPVFCSVDGILFDKAASILLRCPGGRTGTVSIPSTVSSIGDNAFSRCEALAGVVIPGGVSSIGIEAFYGCDSLTSITFPASVTSIGDEAFNWCDNLKSVCFTGNAPTTGYSVFEGTVMGFAVYFFGGAIGFTSPVWNGYPSVNMGAHSPVAPWLIENGFSHDADLQADPNDDGVNLLMAYALKLNPRLNLRGSLPQAVLANSQLSLNFYGASDGVGYSVESSPDLIHWSAEEVIISAQDANGLRVATVPASSASRFIRLMVEY